MDTFTLSSRLRLENQVAVVTGGAQGIGAGIVRRFVQEGARFVFSDLLTEKGKILEAELGRRSVLPGRRNQSSGLRSFDARDEKLLRIPNKSKMRCLDPGIT